MLLAANPSVIALAGPKGAGKSTAGPKLLKETLGVAEFVNSDVIAHGIRCPLVLKRLEWDETSGQVVDRARPGRRDARAESVARWDVLEFLARVLDHLPDPSQQLLRYWGWYSNAARGHRLRQQGASSAQPRASTDPADGESRQRRLTWS